MLRTEYACLHVDLLPEDDRPAGYLLCLYSEEESVEYCAGIVCMFILIIRAPTASEVVGLARLRQ